MTKVMRYRSVNHEQTARQELSGGYLWSPKREASGARSQFYDNMRIAEAGDAVLSFSSGVISSDVGETSSLDGGR